MANIREILQSQQQDAIVWKSKKLWRTAINPDKEVEITDAIANTLMCIKNKMKRERYVSVVSTNVNAEVSAIQQNLNAVEKEQLKLQKAFAKNKSSHIELQLKTIDEQLSELKAFLVPKLKETALKQVLKDLDKKRLANEKLINYKSREVKTKLEPQDIGLPEGWDGDFNAAINYGIYEDNHQYFVRGAKNIWNNVSTFTMKVHYLVRESIDSAYRVISMTNQYGQERTLTINTDDMTTTGAFKKIVNRLSNFSWQGKEEDLSKLNEYLQKDEKHALQLNILGWNSRYKFWAWGNGIYDLKERPTFIAADEFGMVTTTDGETFYIPSANQLTSLTDDIDDSSPDSRFQYTDTQVNFSDWADLHYKVYGRNAIIGQLWFAATLFRDIIFGHPSIKRFPLLFLYGPPGSGKGVFAESLLSGHGFPQNSISLESNTSTPKGMLRSFAQFRNGIVWLDEYKNSLPKNQIATLKQLYDGRSYTRAKKSNDAATESTPINSSGITSGQDMPTIEAALLERYILLQFKPGKNRAEEQGKAYDKLKLMEAEGLSSIAHDILQHRNLFAKTFMDNFRIEYKTLKLSMSEKGITERYQMNFAILMATYQTLNGKVNFSQKKEHYVRALLCEKAEIQFNITKQNNDVAKFWKTVEFLIMQGLLIEDKHFKFAQDGDTKVIWFRLQEAHNLYMKELRSAGDNFGLDKATMENYLRNSGGIYLDYKKVSIGSVSLHAYKLNYSLIEQNYEVTFDMRKPMVPPANSEEAEYTKPFSTDRLSQLDNNPLDDQAEIPFH